MGNATFELMRQLSATFAGCDHPAHDRPTKPGEVHADESGRLYYAAWSRPDPKTGATTLIWRSVPGQREEEGGHAP